MIIGNGLIAKEFKKNENFYEEYVIFASGVSNSKTTNLNDYDRELTLIQNYLNLNDNIKFIYFSSCSIFDESLKNSMYVQHKLKMEEYILNNFKNYLIYRLPIVVGFSQNPNTLTNFIYNSIIKMQNIDIYKYACRYLIDVEDVIMLVDKTLKENNKIINLSLGNKIDIHELVKIFEKLLECKAKKSFIDKGSCYEIDNFYIKKFIKEIKIEEYNYNLVAKYYMHKKGEILV